MAVVDTTLQLVTPCSMAELSTWWAGVQEVIANEEDAEVTVIMHADGPRITVHIREEISSG